MAFRHTTKQKLAAEHDLRIARLVVRTLRRAGFDAALFDKRDVFGARLVPANAHVGKLYLICRRTSDRVTLHELGQMKAWKPYFVQYGGSDLARLIQWIQTYSAPHWNTPV